MVITPSNERRFKKKSGSVACSLAERFSIAAALFMSARELDGKCGLCLVLLVSLHSTDIEQYS